MNYKAINWRASRTAAKNNGVKLSQLALELGVNYGSLNVLLTGRHRVDNPEASTFIRTVAEGLAKRGFLVMGDDSEGKAA